MNQDNTRTRTRIPQGERNPDREGSPGVPTDLTDFYVDAYAAEPGTEYSGHVRVVFRFDSLSGKGTLVVFRDADRHCLKWYSEGFADPVFHKGAELDITGVIGSNRIYKGVHQTALRSVEVVPQPRPAKTSAPTDKRLRSDIVEESWREILYSDLFDMRHPANILGTDTKGIFSALRAAGVLVRTADGHAPTPDYSALFHVVRVETEGGTFDKTQARPFAMPTIARAWEEHGR